MVISRWTGAKHPERYRLVRGSTSSSEGILPLPQASAGARAIAASAARVVRRAMSRSGPRLRRSRRGGHPAPRTGDDPQPRSDDMKYVLMIYGNEELWSSFPQEEFERVVTETNALQAELKASGEFVGAYGVGDQVLAKTVTLDDGAPVVTDGPYIEAKEYLGSFDIIDVDSLERAL